MDSNIIKKNIEALLFAYGEKLDISKLSELLNINEIYLSDIISEMITEYDSETRGIHLIKFGKFIQLATKPECYDVLKKLSDIKFPKILSESAMEVLSIIAYRQPVTNVEIDNIRGIKSNKTIQNLLEKRLIREKGYSDMIGNPVLYVTTEEFLKAFGFNSIEDLPELSFVSEEEILEILNNSEVNDD